MPPVPGLSEAQIAAGNRNLKATSLATSGSGRLQVGCEIKTLSLSFKLLTLVMLAFKKKK
jgi:hypothetical protein